MREKARRRQDEGFGADSGTLRRTEAPKGKGKKPVNKDRFVSKMCSSSSFTRFRARELNTAAMLSLEGRLSCPRCVFRV